MVCLDAKQTLLRACISILRDQLTVRQARLCLQHDLAAWFMTIRHGQIRVKSRIILLLLHCLCLMLCQLWSRRFWLRLLRSLRTSLSIRWHLLYSGQGVFDPLLALNFLSMWSIVKFVKSRVSWTLIVKINHLRVEELWRATISAILRHELHELAKLVFCTVVSHAWDVWEVLQRFLLMVLFNCFVK